MQPTGSQENETNPQQGAPAANQGTLPIRSANPVYDPVRGVYVPRQATPAASSISGPGAGHTAPVRQGNQAPIVPAGHPYSDVSFAPPHDFRPTGRVQTYPGGGRTPAGMYDTHLSSHSNTRDGRHPNLMASPRPSLVGPPAGTGRAPPGHPAFPPPRRVSTLPSNTVGMPSHTPLPASTVTRSNTSSSSASGRRLSFGVPATHGIDQHPFGDIRRRETAPEPSAGPIRPPTPVFAGPSRTYTYPPVAGSNNPANQGRQPPGGSRSLKRELTPEERDTHARKLASGQRGGRPQAMGHRNLAPTTPGSANQLSPPALAPNPFGRASMRPPPGMVFAPGVRPESFAPRAAAPFNPPGPHSRGTPSVMQPTRQAQQPYIKPEPTDESVWLGAVPVKRESGDVKQEVKQEIKQEPGLGMGAPAPQRYEIPAGETFRSEHQREYVTWVRNLRRGNNGVIDHPQVPCHRCPGNSAVRGYAWPNRAYEEMEMLCWVCNDRQVKQDEKRRH